MSSKDMKALAKMTSVQLKTQLTEALRDGVRLGAKIQAGTDPKAAQLAKSMRKRIARIQTLLRQREST